MSQKTALIECVSAWVKLREVDGAEDLGAALVGEVEDLLPVLDAVARVAEPGFDGELAAVQRCRRGNDLECRAGKVEARRGAVEERPAAELRSCGLAVVVFDQVRVVGRARGADEQPPGARLQRDRRAAATSERVQRDPLGARAQREDEVVALDRRPLEPVERRVEHGAQVRVRSSQEVVLGRLEPRARAHLGRVADDVRGEPVLRVLPKVESLAANLSPDVVGEHRLAVGRIDLPALDRELGDDLDRVVLLVGEARRGPGLPVGRADDERGEQHRADDRDPCDLAVHGWPSIGI